METNLLTSDKEKISKIKHMRITSFICCAIQIIIIATVLYYFFENDWNQEIEENLLIAFPDDSSKENYEQVKKITRFCLIFCLKSSFFISTILIIWKIIYNIKYLRFFDGNVNWINNYSFYVFYSMTTPIYCTLVKSKDYIFYDYFVYAEIYSAYIMAFAFLFSLLVIVWFFAINNIGTTREVGRHWEGNTQIISYEFVDGPDFGCGCKYVKKIFGCSHRMLNLFGLIILCLLIAGMNNYFVKVSVIIEFVSNIYLYIIIWDLRKFLKNSKVNLI